LIAAWRLCRAPHAALDGEGARRFGGRWNSAGRPVVYLSEHPALALLEVLVHLDLPPEDLPDDYVMLRVALPDDTPPAQVAPEDTADPRAAGDAWLEGRKSAVLRVPSVLVPQAMNLLCNPLHPAAQAVRIEATLPFRFDPRLLRAA
jgi:RES domain-containing protein